MIAMESMILYKRNKTSEWLKTKSDEEKREMFKGCIKLGRQQRMIIIQTEKTTNVTGFRKTDHIVTIDIARNTDLKY